MKRYNPSEIEPKWQQHWAENHTYEASDDQSRQKTYVAGMFPYPSGAGLHVGHVRNYSIVDVIARFHRQRGSNVLQPFGWDTFGLPAENYAIKTGRQPAEVTHENIASFKNQLTRLGVSIDWSRELNTSDPEYYKWTQWIFTKLFERGLAYQATSLQWWCPFDKTVLANEQVEGGHCWRCGNVVEKKSMKQWFFKITEYADSLLEEIPDLAWPQKIKTAQTNWIGRSEGAEVEFKVEHAAPAAGDGRDETIRVFTTRPDTIFGATFLVLAPEHALVPLITTSDASAVVDDYLKLALKRSEIDRMNESREKTGVPTGAHAINPATGERIPIWIADYVLGGYGTGAIMAVPAHDQRDFEFANKYRLPVVQVVANYNVNAGINAPREGFETLNRPVVDAIIVNQQGEYLLEVEEDNVHFVGGGIEPEDSDEEASVRREVIEEVGYDDFASIRAVSPIIRTSGFRIPKNKNQQTTGRFYEVVLNSDSQIESEIEAGRHSIKWVKKEDVASELTWEGHKIGWEYYLSENDQFVNGEGVLVNSGQFNGMNSSEAREKIVAWLEEKNVGHSKVTYKMRDWLISRQRYWGAPIPIIHCEEHGAVAVPEDQLPVLLPHVDSFAPTGDGKSPLASATDWVNTTCPTCGRPAQRETDTMDGYACSSWYLLRYADPHNSERAWDPDKANYWAPLDFYCGADHAVQHLLYVRFWMHAFRDMGLINFREPVKQLVFNGYINAADGSKMSKSKGNVVDPLELVDQGYGADALRVYELFIGPYDLDASWEPGGIAGTYRFLNRVWTLVQEYLAADISAEINPVPVLTARSKTVKKVTDDLTRLSFNTAISALMEYTNDLYKLKLDGFDRNAWPQALTALLQLVAPFAPHLSAELLGELDATDAWPEWDDALLVSDRVTIIVQVNGKLRARLEVGKDSTQEEISALAAQQETVTNALGGSQPKKTIYVSGKLLNFVV